MTNAFDRSGLDWAAGLAMRNPRWDAFVYYLVRADLWTGALALAGFWWAWFRPRRNAAAARASLLCTLLGGIIAVTVGRALALGLPFRARPLHDAGTHFPRVPSIGANELQSWSSFPSDHALFFFELAAGVAFVWPAAGFWLALHALLIISLPRVLLGLHYPSDILGGAAIGAAIAWAVQRRWFRERFGAPLASLEASHPGPFHAGLFLVTFLLITLFKDIRGFIALFLGNPAR